MRVGFGYDSHRFEEDAACRPRLREEGVDAVYRPRQNGKRLILGGVEIPDAPGLKAHSDGDVVIHALIDALLGAAALGDIGSHFPDTDERWRGADSMKLLAAVVKELAEAGYTVHNADITVICEKPRLRPHVDAIRARLAGLLGIPVARLSVKGKTNEKMDDVGAGVGIEVHAVALLEEGRGLQTGEGRGL